MSKQIVFCATSPYHLVCSIYYAKNIESSLCRKVLIWEQTLSKELDLTCVSAFFDEIIVVGNIQKKHANVLKRHFNWCLNMGWLFPFSRIFRTLTTHSTVVAVVFCDRDFLTYKVAEQVSQLGGRVILVDEGMYTYSVVGNPKIKLIRRLLGMRKSAYVGQAPYIDTIIARHPENLPSRKTIGREVVPQDNVFLMKGFIAEIGSLLELDHCLPKTIRSGSKTLLWVGGPLDGVDDAVELRTLRNIIESFPNYSFIIKEHPREKPNKYHDLEKIPNVSVINLGASFWCPIEIIAGKLAPVAMLSFQSSALINCWDLGIRTLYCYCFKFLPAIEIDPSAYAPYSGLYFPENVVELHKKIESSQKREEECNLRIRRKDTEYLTRIINHSASSDGIRSDSLDS